MKFGRVGGVERKLDREGEVREGRRERGENGRGGEDGVSGGGERCDVDRESESGGGRKSRGSRVSWRSSIRSIDREDIERESLPRLARRVKEQDRDEEGTSWKRIGSAMTLREL
jgi:hypothetical protein